MSTIEEISLLAFALTLGALFNWLVGVRSFRGRQLLIRQGKLWVGARWFGFGLWVASMVASGHDDLQLASAGLVGAVILMFGTARKASIAIPS